MSVADTWEGAIDRLLLTGKAYGFARIALISLPLWIAIVSLQGYLGVKLSLLLFIACDVASVATAIYWYGLPPHFPRKTMYAFVFSRLGVMFSMVAAYGGGTSARALISFLALYFCVYVAVLSLVQFSRGSMTKQ